MPRGLESCVSTAENPLHGSSSGRKRVAATAVGEQQQLRQVAGHATWHNCPDRPQGELVGSEHCELRNQITPESRRNFGLNGA